VINICVDLPGVGVFTARLPMTTQSGKPYRDIPGYVYVYQMGTTGAYKIGFTGSKESERLFKLQTGNPEPVRQLSITSVTSTHVERALHIMLHHFKPAKPGGQEWFLPTGTMVRFIPEIHEAIKSIERQLGVYIREQITIEDVISTEREPAVPDLTGATSTIRDQSRYAAQATSGVTADRDGHEVRRARSTHEPQSISMGIDTKGPQGTQLEGE
jgi:hypothetical protein